MARTHDFDQADIFFFDVLDIRMWMVNAIWMLWRGLVVTEHQVQFIMPIADSSNGGNGMVRLTVRCG